MVRNDIGEGERGGGDSSGVKAGPGRTFAPAPSRVTRGGPAARRPSSSLSDSPTWSHLE